ncbi:MAG: tetratricopeptide repeat protein [Chthoniobacterales bacterium]
MKKLRAGGFGLGVGLILFVSLGNAAEPTARLAEAIQPLSDGVPQVAVVRLRALLAGEIPDDLRNAAALKLGEALVASDDFAEALKVLSDPPVSDSTPAKFLRAQANAGLDRWAEALPLYRACAAESAAPLRADALFGQAEALRALAMTDEALQTFEPLRRDERWGRRAIMRTVELLLQKGDADGATRWLDSIQPTSATERSERRLLRGRIQLAKNRTDKAIQLWTSLLKNPAGASHPVMVATLFALAELHLQMGTPGAGDDYLEEFIEHQPNDPGLPAIFAKLDQLYAAERKPSQRELARWSRDAAEPRRSFSRWDLARAELRLGRRDLALQTFAQLRAEHPRLPALADAFLEYARLQLADGQFPEVSATLESARALQPEPAMIDRINLLAGENDYAAKQFEPAAKTFQQSAAADSPFAKVAHYNAALAWLQAGDAAQFKSSANGSDDPGDLLLEEGLVQAGRGDATAVNSLGEFLRQYPKHARVSEAWVALAEIAFQAAPPRLPEAREDLAHAAENQPTPAATERADYLMIWIEEASAPPNEEKVIALASQFLQKHEASALLPEVRLKLAECFYRRQDFASAQTQFEILAQKNPSSPMAEKAQFFAAQSAEQSMGAGSLDHALELFGAVVKRNGEMKWAARNEQAVIERKLGKADDAMTLYDEILRGDAPPADKREALCARGDILYELGAKDRENYRRAIGFYSELATQPDASAHWRHQALFKQGMCLEKLEEPAQALTAFYEIIEDTGKPERHREYFWFYKAGFNAARLLEEQSKWQPAAAIYEKLAFAGGGRSEEAKSRLDRLRLEHFLWDQ